MDQDESCEGAGVDVDRAEAFVAGVAAQRTHRFAATTHKDRSRSQGMRHHPTSRPHAARSSQPRSRQKPDLVRIDGRRRANGGEGADGVRRYEVEVAVHIGTARALGLADAALVVGKEGDPVPDAVGDERPILQPRLLTAAEARSPRDAGRVRGARTACRRGAHLAPCGRRGLNPTTLLRRGARSPACASVAE